MRKWFIFWTDPVLSYQGIQSINITLLKLSILTKLFDLVVTLYRAMIDFKCLSRSMLFNNIFNYLYYFSIYPQDN